VLAHNSRGWSSASLANTAGPTIQTEPNAMAAPTRGSTTSTTIVEVDWAALISPANGDSSITSYNLKWDAGTSGVTWTDLIGLSPSSTATSYSLTTGITAGSSYQFKVRARNAFGWGSYSSVATITAATIPS
jgi:hypothetical protein